MQEVKQYDVTMTETVQVTDTVSTTGKTEAERIMEKKWRDGGHVLDAGHVKEVKFEAVDEARQKRKQAMDEWREQYYAPLKECRSAIVKDSAMSAAYHDRTFPAYMEQLIDVHCLERVSLVLCVTIRRADWDGRYYRDVKEWARNYPEIEQPPFRLEGQKRDFLELHLDTHPVILNQAAKALMQRERGITPQKKEWER